MGYEAKVDSRRHLVAVVYAGSVDRSSRYRRQTLFTSMTLHFSVSHPSEFYLQGPERNIMQVTIGSRVVAVIYGYDALRPMLVSLNKSGNPRKPKKTNN